MQTVIDSKKLIEELKFELHQQHNLNTAQLNQVIFLFILFILNC